MLVLLKATYPPSSAKKAIEVFMAPETPKRSATAKELASFVHGDHEGYHNLFILEVEDTKFAEFMKAQTSRNAYMQSRIDGLGIEVVPGHSVMDTIALTSKQLG